MSESEDFHEFAGVRFYAQQRRLLRVSDRAEFFIRPKERDFLQLLLRRPQQTVLYEEFRDKVWPDAKDVRGLLPTLRETKRTLDELLGEITKRPGEIIETVAKRGYRLNVEVKSPVESEASERGLSFERRLCLPFGGHGWHILAACCLYGALYSLAVPLELAYQFDRFGTRATLVAPAVFSWMVTCSAISLYADWKITLRRKGFGLAVLMSGFLVPGILLYITLIFVLPDFPITESKSFQAHTAQGAYLKNIAFYFLPLGILFFALPYHFVAVLSTAVQKVTQQYNSPANKAVIESGTAVYISVRTLGLILGGAAIVSVLLTFHLLDNLTPSPYRNLFTQLVILRATLIFGLGLECALWYSRRLNEINHLLRAKNFQS
jgi:DNA-binding winged helix-turn-helix (wHTH) protein